MTSLLVADTGRVDAAGQVIRLVNEHRRAAGLHPLRLEVKLRKIARHRARHIEATGKLSHTGWEKALRQFGFRASRPAGENLAAGFDTAAEVVEAWMRSPKHRENVMDPDFRSIGVARVDDVWVQIFGGR